MSTVKLVESYIDRPKDKPARKRVRVECVIHSLCFTQRAEAFNIQRGCIICIKEAQTKNQVKTLDHHLNLFKKAHGDTYDYSKVDYKTSKVKIEIVCKTHGAFWQRPDCHKEGDGCSSCAGNKRKTLSEFKQEASLKHNNFYDYSKFKYINSQIKSIIVCPKHGDFRQNSNSHLNGAGCPKCVVRLGANIQDFIASCDKNSGFGFLYILKCTGNGEEFYKIGATSTGIKRRFGSNFLMPYNFELVHYIKDKAETVFEVERFLLDYYKSIQYIPELKFKGYTECFKLVVN